MNARRAFRGAALLLLAVAVAGCVWFPGPPSEAELRAMRETAQKDADRAAVRLALPHIARQTSAWIERSNCTSCHQVPHSLWAMNGARAAGFDVDERLVDWNKWSVQFVMREAEKADDKEKEAGPRARADEVGQMLLAGELGEASHARLIEALRRGRHEDGRWHAGGQLPGQKRPLQETNEATTMWSLWTLRSASGADVVTGDTEPKIEMPSTSTEHLVLRYLLANGIGDTQAATLRSELLSHQNDDGGWGWLLTDRSDALATGQALYALSYMEPEHRRDAVERARRFLTSTQQADGSWHVPSTLKEKAGEAYAVSNDWGTAWAVIGLLRWMEP